MDTPVTAKTALLQVLLDGRGYGSELAARVATRTQGRITLSQGSLYPALAKFEKSGLVESYDEEGNEKKDNHMGRPRIYYQLTKEGRAEAKAQRAMLAQLIGVELPKKSRPAKKSSDDMEPLPTEPLLESEDTDPTVIDAREVLSAS